jgi:hypothetical protein
VQDSIRFVSLVVFKLVILSDMSGRGKAGSADSSALIESVV